MWESKAAVPAAAHKIACETGAAEGAAVNDGAEACADASVADVANDRGAVGSAAAAARDDDTAASCMSILCTTSVPAEGAGDDCTAQEGHMPRVTVNTSAMNCMMRDVRCNMKQYDHHLRLRRGQGGPRAQMPCRH